MTSTQRLEVNHHFHGRFRKGPDPRRHVFTREEQSRGGRTTWNRYMRQWRAEMKLPQPPELRAADITILRSVDRSVELEMILPAVAGDQHERDQS
jgi:hypothetical protein